MSRPPVLRGELVTLRPSRPGDAEVRARFGRTPEVSRGFGLEVPEFQSMTVDEARVQIDFEFGEGPHWVVADENDQYLGNARLVIDEDRPRTARYAIGLFDPTRLGCGLGTEANRLAISHGLGDGGFDRIELAVFADNVRAIRSYERVGFRVVDRTPGVLDRDGLLIDDVHMVVTPQTFQPGA